MTDWASDNLHWLSEKEKQASLKARTDILNLISPNCQTSAKKSLYHLGNLSQACKACIDGKWACIYLTHQCTRNCFFCPQPDHKNQPQINPYTENIQFSNIDQVLVYLEDLGIQSVSFSGGEPLLRPGLLLSYITSIRKAFGSSMYIWMNTNGDLLTNEIMKNFIEAGLNEIRIDLGATHYQLDPVKMALAYDLIVSVETPAIPEDLEHFKSILLPLKKMGLDHIILNQIFVNQHNFKSLNHHPYHAVGTTPPVIYESEITALELIQYTIEQHLDLPVLYCSDIYKSRFQSKGRRHQALAAAEEEHSLDKTPLGYLREIRLLGSQDLIQQVTDRLKQKNISKELWAIHEEDNSLIVNSQIMEKINYSPFQIHIVYYDIKLKKTAYTSQPFSIDKQEVFRTHKQPGKWIKAWYHSFISQDWDKRAVKKHLFQSTGDLSRNTLLDIQHFMMELNHIRSFEVLEEGLQSF